MDECATFECESDDHDCERISWLKQFKKELNSDQYKVIFKVLKASGGSQRVLN